MNIRPILLALSLLLAACAGKDPWASPMAPYAEGQLVLPNGAPADTREFLRLARDARFILVGEIHDSPVHHKVQAALLAALLQDGREPLLGLEMIPADAGPRLASFTAGKATVEDLPALLDWRNTWGFDFALYRPLFTVAEKGRVPVFGLNIPQRVIQAVREGGLAGVPTKDRRWLPEHLSPPPEEQRKTLEEVFRRHAAMRAVAAPSPPHDSARSESGLERFLLIQSLWDSGMAERALAAQKRLSRPMLIATGRAHVENGYGIAHRLRALDPEARVLLVLPFASERPEAGEGDLFFYAAPPRQDPPGAHTGGHGKGIDH